MNDFASSQIVVTRPKTEILAALERKLLWLSAWTIDVSLYQVKTPAESKRRWDCGKEVARVPAMDVHHPLDTTARKNP